MGVCPGFDLQTDSRECRDGVPGHESIAADRAKAHRATTVHHTEDDDRVKSYPRISIVTISYNQAEFLEQTMGSVLGQNYPNLEYIVIDGGSKDCSVEIIRRNADKLAYWVSEPDRGPADAINKGFAHATGEILGWINSSDVHYPWTLHTVAEVFEEIKEARWVTGVASHLDAGMGPKGIGLGVMSKYDFLARQATWLQQESTFWRKDLWDEAGGYLDANVKHMFEYGLWLRFALLAPLYQVNTILAGFRVHGERIIPSSADVQRQEQLYREYCSQFGFMDILRSKIVKHTRGVEGSVLRGILHRMGLMKWYEKPRIVRDFDHQRWLVK